MPGANHGNERMPADRRQPAEGEPSAAAQDDLQLVRQCAGGDAAAWETFLARYTPLMAGVIRKVLLRYRSAGESNAEDAFAAVIEVLLRDDARVLRSFREPYNLAAWLSVLTRRQTRAYLETRRIPETGVETMDGIGDAGPVIDELVARENASRREALGRAVRGLLDELSPRDRLLVTLFYFDHRPYRDIARIVRMPVGNVGKTLARALVKLKTLAGNAGWRVE
jgi:RNA polymerase sigma factor (sigma-70 family)